MNQIKSIERANEAELALGISAEASWHAEFAHSPYIYTGGLPYELNEGDILVVFSQYGVIEGIKLHRDPDTGKSKGFAFLRYRDPRSCVLAVDNFNGVELLKRKIRVNHVKNYEKDEEMDVVAERLKQTESDDEEKKRRRERKEESRKVELMRAAMSQDPEERKRAIEKEQRRAERRSERSERREREDDYSRSKKKSKHREYDDEDPMADMYYDDMRHRDAKEEDSRRYRD